MPSIQNVPWTLGTRGRLAALCEKKPNRKAAQIRALWADIKGALNNGHSLKTVCECLEAECIPISVATLGSYITRIRRKEGAQATGELIPTRFGTDPTRPDPANQFAGRKLETNPDSLANLRQREASRPTFDYRPESADPSKLI